jgi:hypothetical protein
VRLAGGDRGVRVAVRVGDLAGGAAGGDRAVRGEPARLAVMGQDAFTALVREMAREWGGQRAWGPACARVFAALTDAEGVIITHRRGLLRWVADELGDLQRARAQRRRTEADMAAVLGELGLSRLGEIPGLSVTGAAAILAETGDPRQYQAS